MKEPKEVEEVMKEIKFLKLDLQKTKIDFEEYASKTLNSESGLLIDKELTITKLEEQNFLLQEEINRLEEIATQDIVY